MTASENRFLLYINTNSHYYLIVSKVDEVAVLAGDSGMILGHVQAVACNECGNAPANLQRAFLQEMLGGL